ncbi:hypothetical protein LguiA_032356 [Lonicera macranthoides]
MDKVSNLPDAILTCVLSSLSTREAVRTSILSTRWKSIWTSVAVEWSWYDHLLTESLTRAAVERNVKDLNLMIGVIRKIENPYYESLKDLTLQFRGGKRLEQEYDAYEQEEEEEQELEQKLVVDAPALESLAIDDNVTFEYTEAKDLFYKSVFDLLRRISNVKFLTLSYETMQAYSENLPTFTNLNRLELFPHEESWHWNLHSRPKKIEGPSLCGVWIVPNCLLSHLKRIKIKGQIWRGGPEEMDFLSKVLEEMTVALVYFQNQSIEELLKLPRVSMTWSDPNLLVTRVLSDIRKPNEQTEPIRCDPKFPEPKKKPKPKSKSKTEIETD